MGAVETVAAPSLTGEWQSNPLQHPSEGADYKRKKNYLLGAVVSDDKPVRYEL